MIQTLIQTTTADNGSELKPFDPLAGLIADWHAYLNTAVAAGELATTSRTTYKTGFAKFAAWLLETGSTATTGSVRDWKAALLAAGNKPASVNVWLAGVRAFYAWANEYERLADNPAARVKGAKRTGTTTSHKRDSLTDSEAVRLLDLELPARDRAIVALFLFCGLRQVEIERANVEDIGTREGVQVLYIQGKGRTTKDEFVIVAGEAEQALAVWLTERATFTTANSGPLFISFSDKNHMGRLSLRGIRDIVKGAMRAAGIVGDRKTTHSLRHTAISSVLRNGGTLQQAQAMARHSNIATTGIYVHDLDRVANAGEKLVNYRKAKP